MSQDVGKLRFVQVPLYTYLISTNAVECVQPTC